MGVPNAEPLAEDMELADTGRKSKAESRHAAIRSSSSPTWIPPGTVGWYLQNSHIGELVEAGKGYLVMELPHPGCVPGEIESLQVWVMLCKPGNAIPGRLRTTRILAFARNEAGPIPSRWRIVGVWNALAEIITLTFTVMLKELALLSDLTSTDGT